MSQPGIVPEENEDRRAAIQARLDAATPGPWTTGGYFVTPGNPVRQNVWGPRQSLDAQSGHILAKACLAADAEFIANAPSDMAYLLSDLATLRARLASSEEERDTAIQDAKNGWATNRLACAQRDDALAALRLSQERVAELEAVKLPKALEKRLLDTDPPTQRRVTEESYARDCVEFVRRLRLTRSRVESSRDATSPEPPNTHYCIECGPDAQFTSAGAMHFDAYGHTPHRIGSPVATAPEKDNG